MVEHEARGAADALAAPSRAVAVAGEHEQVDALCGGENLVLGPAGDSLRAAAE